ncbi:MAG: 50S ribosomal protein L29 [Chlamydiales bacterium]
MLQVKELREKNVTELREQERELAKEVYEMYCELSLSRKLEKPHLVREKKRDRAKLLTVLREKQESVR